MKEHPILHALHFHGVPMSDQKQSQFGKASKSKNNIFFAETDDFAGVTAQVVGGNNDVNRLYARRIVACVNACAGYTTEELEQAMLDKRHRHEIIADLVKSNKQRDELLAALEHILAGSLSLPRFAEAEAISVIASVKDNTK